MRKNYIAPDKKLQSFTCPHCNTVSLMQYAYHIFQDDINLSLGNEPITSKKLKLTIARCENCHNKILWIDDEYIYPDIIAEDANEDMPDSVKQLYDEASLIYNKSPRAACALLRLAIDRLCNELGLVKKGLPKTVQQALDVVRVVGNKAVHPGQIAFDVDDKNTATMLMRLLNIIVERMITEPKEIDSLYQGLPESVRNAIENRDK